MSKIEVTLKMQDKKKGSIVFSDDGGKLPSQYIPKATLAELGGDEGDDIIVTLERK